MQRTHRNHSLWLAFSLHRISGLVLAIFLPVHFYVLGLALNDAAELDSFLVWTKYPIVKFAEAGLVFLLALHIFGGLRLLVLEFTPWSSRQKNYAALVVALSFVAVISFLLNAD